MKARLSICFLLLVSLALPLVSADPINPEDIKIESNGTHFQYGDTLRITVFGENNTTYRFYIEDKSYVLRMYYMEIWCNWSGVGTASRVLIRPDKEPRSDMEIRLQPRWHFAYIKLANVTSNNPSIEFVIDVTAQDILDGFIETSGDIKETDKEEGFWNDFRITSVLIILILVNIAVLWKKILPVKVRLGEPIYDKRLGMMVAPFRQYTKLERVLMGISDWFSSAHTRHKMKRKGLKTPYTRNIETDVFPPEKAKQLLDSMKKYLIKLEVENTALLKVISVEKAKLEELRAAPDVERDIQAIHMKENEIQELRAERAKKGTQINDTKKDIKNKEIGLKKLFEEEKKGVFIK